MATWALQRRNGSPALESGPLSLSSGPSLSYVPAGGRILQLSLVQAEDAGRYSCKASNEVGEDWLHYQLLVLSEWLRPGGTGRLQSRRGLLLKVPGGSGVNSSVLRRSVIGLQAWCLKPGKSSFKVQDGHFLTV